MEKLAKVEGVNIQINRDLQMFGTPQISVKFFTFGDPRESVTRLANAMRAQADLLDPPHARAIESALQSEAFHKSLTAIIANAVSASLAK